MESKENYINLMKTINGKRYQKYYNLKEVAQIKGMSYKSAKNMVGPIYAEYSSQGSIKKIGKQYQILYILLDKFTLKKPRKTTTVNNHMWVTNLGWTIKDHYEVDYHYTLFQKLKGLVPETNFYGCIEQDDSGRNHVHLLADSAHDSLRPILIDLLDEFLDNGRFYSPYCEPPYNVAGSLDYINKGPQKILQ